MKNGGKCKQQAQGAVTPISAILTAATGVTVWSRGHSVVTGSQCGHGVTEDFWVWSQGHRRIFGVVTGSRKFFSTVAWGHGAVPQVPSSSAAYALSESIVY